MSDDAAGAPVTTPVAAAERGHLTVAPKAVESVVRRVAQGAARRLGADASASPAVSSRVAGARASVDLALTLPWGQVVEESARAVHREVRERTSALTGLTVDDVRLTVRGLATTTPGPYAVSADTAPRPAPAPKGAGAAVAWGLLLSVAVLVLGAVAAHDALSAWGALGEEQWLPVALDAVDGTTPQPWVLAAGIVAVVAGLALVVAALRPRPRRALGFTDPASVSLLSRDLARTTSGLARQVDGVLDATSDHTRRRVRIWVETTGDTQVLTDVRERVTEQLSVLRRPPKVVVVPTNREEATS